MPVEPLFECHQLTTQLLVNLEPLDPQQLLLEGTDQTLCVPVPPRRAHEAWTRLDSEKRQLVLEMATDVLRAARFRGSESASW